MNDYESFLDSKKQISGYHGFAPTFVPDYLFDFQKSLLDWSVRKGRSAIFADCGMGKSILELVWADNVVRHTNKPVLLLTPLAVGPQMIREAERFGIDAVRSLDGSLSGSKIVVANYERLHYFDPKDFSGVVCDESSILKSFSGETRKRVTRFVSKLQFRLLGTATAAPNDYVEMGTSSEALGELSYSDMLRVFFAQQDDKGQRSELKKQHEAEAMIAAMPNYYKQLAFRVAQTIGQWRLRHHAVTSFWRWMASWARACRKPSDLGFSDERFILPELIEKDHVISPKEPPPGRLFNTSAFGMHEERQERKRTLEDRCGYVADLVKHDKPAVVWCHTNDEADRLVEMIPDSQQVAGRTADDRKVELYEAFASGSLRVMVIKPKIGAWGLNWQHCNHVVTFVSHSYEQHYQAVRRCWRFGQKNPVRLDVVATEGEDRVLENMRSKADKMNTIFTMLVKEMSAATRVEREDRYTNSVKVPSWLA